MMITSNNDSCMEDGLHVSLRNSGKHAALKPSCLHVPRCIFSDVCRASCAAHIADGIPCHTRRTFLSPQFHKLKPALSKDF